MLRPIVFLHRGCPDYLKITLAKARLYNPDSPLILLGDSSNAHIVRDVPNLEFEPMQWESGDAVRFAAIYQHQGILKERVERQEFERFCIQRWILLRDLMYRRNWNRLLHIDSDVLLFSEIEQTGKRFDDNAMSLAPWEDSLWSGHTCFVNSPDVLNEFVNFLFDLYTTKEGKQLREKAFADLPNRTFSDMTCLSLFRQRVTYPIADMSRLIDNTVFDDRITTTSGIYEKGSRFFKKDWKKIVFKDSVPYCRLKEIGENIRFLSLHFHGGTKYMIKHFAKGHIDIFSAFAMVSSRLSQKFGIIY